MRSRALTRRLEAERRLASRRSPGQEETPEDTRSLAHELEVHQIELEMQNDELRRAHDELELLRAKYFDLFDLAPVGYAILGKQGLIQEANLTLMSRLGVTRKALVGHPLSRFVNPTSADAYTLQLRRLFESGEPSSFEVGMVMEDGTPFRGRIDAAVRTKVGVRATCRIALTSVTEGKREEDAAGDLSRTSRALAT